MNCGIFVKAFLPILDEWFQGKKHGKGREEEEREEEEEEEEEEESGGTDKVKRIDKRKEGK